MARYWFFKILIVSRERIIHWFFHSYVCYMNNFQKIIKVFLWLRTFVAFWSTKNDNSSKRKDIKSVLLRRYMILWEKYWQIFNKFKLLMWFNCKGRDSTFIYMNVTLKLKGKRKENDLWHAHTNSVQFYCSLSWWVSYYQNYEENCRMKSPYNYLWNICLCVCESQSFTLSWVASTLIFKRL